MTNTKKLFFIIFALFLFIYVKYYLKVVPNFKIVQLSVTELSPVILKQRNPIIIDEKIVSPISLLHSVFKYSYIYKKINNTPRDKNNTWYQNKSKYIIFYSNNNNAIISIQNPKLKQKKEQDILLPAHMCLILPYYWMYSMKNSQNFTYIKLDDLTSIFFGKLF